MQTGMYAISEMASLFNVSRQTLIYYDKIGLFKPAVVNEKGYRFYSPTQIPLMRLICMLRDLGLELDEIDRLTSTFDIGEMTDHLRSRVQALDEQIAELKAERASVQERLSFYDEAVYWREREGKPELKQFERRYVVFEEFPGDIERGRSMLHPTLMRAILRMRALTGTRPMRGWGAMLRREALHSDDPIAGAGSFAVLPRGAEEMLPSRCCRAGRDRHRSAARGHIPVHEPAGACRTSPRASAPSWPAWTSTRSSPSATLSTFATSIPRATTSPTKRTSAASKSPSPSRCDKGTAPSSHSWCGCCPNRHNIR